MAIVPGLTAREGVAGPGLGPFSKVLPSFISVLSGRVRALTREGPPATCQGDWLYKHPRRLGAPRHRSPQLPGHSAAQRVGRRQALQQPLQGQPQEVQLLGGLLELGLSLQRGQGPWGMGRGDTASGHPNGV